MFGWLKELVTPVTGLIRGLVTTDKDRLDAVKDLAEIDMDLAKEELQFKITLAKNGNWYTKSVRPTIAYTFLGLYINSKRIQDWVFTEGDYELFLYIVGFYFSFKTVEKGINLLGRNK